MEASVELRITYDYKQKYLATGVKLKKKQWHDGTVINHPAAPQLNLTLQKIIRNAQEAINEMLDEVAAAGNPVPSKKPEGDK